MIWSVCRVTSLVWMFSLVLRIDFLCSDRFYSATSIYTPCFALIVQKKTEANVALSLILPIMTMLCARLRDGVLNFNVTTACVMELHRVFFSQKLPLFFFLQC